MDHKAQSILDLILPNRLMLAIKSPISNKEAKTLLQLWDDGQKDQYGRIKVPDAIDGEVIVSLASKGYLSTIGGRASIVSHKDAAAVTFTKKAKEVIKKIILHAESSSFEKGEEPDYESIMIMAETNESKGKVASRQMSPAPDHPNWLQKAIWK